MAISGSIVLVQAKLTAWFQNHPVGLLGSLCGPSVSSCSSFPVGNFCWFVTSLV